ncbi:hypothetical protein SEA_NYCEIRAE_58 [Gordonia phage Nyceirae]|uniref:Uncharacterized protein n=1 Tax=Gordonia phage Nyceirae TaxID=1887651 RepID=A0A1C9EI14_9CAUD|nr:hypothetical protein BIZ68_gp58 [Gordonia phage Nyceirae]AON97421.1 hypothetical protein SEA_NYCEIRAE_58 [Gordonia phage Nyceirae]
MTEALFWLTIAAVWVLLSPKVFYRVVVAITPNTAVGQRAARLLAAHRGRPS